MINMNEKVALITGATKGIGKAVALKLARKQMKLIITGRSKQGLEEVQEEAEKHGAEVFAIQADLTKDQAPRKILEKGIKQFEHLDYLINNAGTALAKKVEETTNKEWDMMMQVNAKAPFLLCREAISLLKESVDPTIINICSVVGRKGYENQAAYSASKHAFAGFTKVLAKEMQHHGIRVHLLNPGGVDTDLIKTMRSDLNPNILIRPDEIAEIVLFLITHKGNAMIDEINIRRANGTPWG